MPQATEFKPPEEPMKTPNLTLMRVYETSDVFFKKASAGTRPSDAVSFAVAGEFLTKVARGIPPSPIKLPSSGMHLPKPTASPGPALKPPPVPNRANPSVLNVKPTGELAPPNVHDFGHTNGAVTSAPPLEPAKRPVQSPLAGPQQARPTAVSGGQAPNINDFTKQPGVLGRLTGQKTSPTGAPTIDPMKGTKDAPSAANKPIGETPQKTEGGKGGLPWNRMLLTGGLLGAGYLGLKGFQAGLNFLGGGHGGPAGYGHAPGGYAPPMGVNAYGYPQLGTPLM